MGGIEFRGVGGLVTWRHISIITMGWRGYAKRQRFDGKDADSSEHIDTEFTVQLTNNKYIIRTCTAPLQVTTTKCRLCCTLCVARYLHGVGEGWGG
eukprot:9500970-Pyramimonas_sp.AAC.1